MPGEKAVKTLRLGYRNQCMVSPPPRLKAWWLNKQKFVFVRGQMRQNNSENGAVMGIPLEGPSSSDHAAFVYVSQEKAGITHKGGYQNNMVNPEVVTTGNSIPLAFF